MQGLRLPKRRALNRFGKACTPAVAGANARASVARAACLRERLACTDLDRQRSLEPGFDEHLVKRIKLDDLTRRLGARARTIARTTD